MAKNYEKSKEYGSFSIKRPISKSGEKYTWFNILQRLPLLLLIPLALLLPLFVKNAPDKVERIYSCGLYPLLSRVLGFITSIIPLSLAEGVIVIGGGIAIAILIVRFLSIPFGKLHSRSRNRIRFYSYLLSIGIFAGVMLNLFYVVWGFNHYRQPLSTLMELDVRNRSVDELAELTEYLAREAGALRAKVEEDKRGIFTVGDRSAAMKAITAAYRKLGTENELFSNKCYTPKTPLLSQTLSKLDIAGIYIPYFAEANVNAEQPDLYFLSCAAHELGHYYGFAAEEEANFIAYYVSLWSSDDAFKYSAVMAALSSCGKSLHSNDSARYSKIWSNFYSEGMQRDLEEYREYYEKYENHPAAQVNNSINDAYLQYHGHDDGLRSYGRDVDLLLALYERGSITNKP